MIAASTGSVAPSAGGGGAIVASHLLEQRRARFGGAVLVAVAVGEEEAAARQRQADAEEVALLGFGVAAWVEAELFALGLGEEGVAAAVAARELAVLQRADEHVVEAGGAQAVGAGDPHPALDRAAPDAEVERADGLGEALRGGGERAERGEVGERGGDRPGGAQLEPVAGAEPGSILTAAEGARGHRRGEAGDVAASAAGDSAAASRRRVRSRGSLPSSPRQRASAVAASSIRSRRIARSSQSTRPGEKPEGPRR